MNKCFPWAVLHERFIRRPDRMTGQKSAMELTIQTQELAQECMTPGVPLAASTRKEFPAFDHGLHLRCNSLT